jgi:serine/threonine protein kinase
VPLFIFAKYVKGQTRTIAAGHRDWRLPRGTQVAAGGFGVVYLALDAEGQQVAIKEYLPASLATRSRGELLPQVPPEKLSLYRLGLKSFFEEGRSLAQISHPSVVSVLNFFRENETVYMVMNYLEGATLQDFIITARDLKQQKVFRESTIRSCLTRSCAACASCTSTRCCTWTSSRPTSSSPTTTRRC